jgi:cytochrome P450
LQDRPDNQGDLITDEEIKDNIVMFLFAGHDTSSITLAAILKYLSLNPHCLHEVVKGIIIIYDMTKFYLPQFILQVFLFHKLHLSFENHALKIVISNV